MLFAFDEASYETSVSLVISEVSVEVSNVPPEPMDEVHSPHAPPDATPFATTSWYSTWVSGSLAASDWSDDCRLVWMTCMSDWVGATVGLKVGATVDGAGEGTADGAMLGPEGGAEGAKEGETVDPGDLVVGALVGRKVGMPVI